jgi:hypothetical protein
MGAIHELLAKIPELESTQAKILDESIKLFGKRELLKGEDKKLVMNDEDRQAEGIGAGSKQEITTTVLTRFAYMEKAVVDRIDAEYQREVANQLAVADVTLPDGTVLTAVPVTMLMWLEKELVRLRGVLNASPTTDTTVRWEKDTDAALEGVRKSVEPKRANKTELTKVPVEMSPATKEHKAQVMVVDEQKVVGYYETTEVTGCLTPHEKMVGLSTIDALIVEVKQAKARANQAAVNPVKMGKQVYDVVMNSMRTAG